MKQMYLLWMCLLFSYFSAGQQQLQGIVVDAQSGDPLVNALVIVGNQMAESDANGRIALSLSSPPPYVIEIYLLGFHKLSIALDSAEKDGVFRFVAPLRAIQEELSTVVVTASRYAQKPEELSVSLSVLKPYLIENRNSNDSEDLLQMTPGVHVTDGQLNIRNGSGWTYGAGSRVQVLLDDLPLISPDAGQVQWNLLPLEALGQVEVLKGSSSALFGTSALNGVVQLRTLVPQDEPLTRVSVYHTLYDAPPRNSLKWWNGWQSRTGIRLLHAFRTGQNDFVLSAYGQKDQGYKWEEIDNRARFNGSWTYRANKQWQAGLSGGVLWSKSGEALLWQSEELGYIALDSSVTVTDGIDLYLDPKVEWNTGAHHHKIHGRYLRVENNARNLTTNFYNASDQAQLQYSYQWFAKQWVISGGLYGMMAESRSALFGGTHNASNWAVYGQIDRKWKTGQINLGWRYENQQVDNIQYARPVLRLGVNQAITPSTFLRASYGEGFRFPSMAELYTATNVGSISIYPNNELLVEEGHSVEIGLRQTAKWNNWQAYLDVAWYRMYFNNMMEFSFSNWGPQPWNPIGVGFKSINIGPAQIQGVEFEIGAEKQWEEWQLRLMGGINFSSPKALDANKVIATDAAGREITYRNSSSDTTNDILKYRYTQLIRLDAELSNKRWTMGMSLRFNDFMQNIDGVFESEIIELFIPGVGIGSARERLNRNDWLLDARVYYHLNTEWQLGFLVENLLNYEVMSRPALLEAPRRFTLSVRFEPQ